MLGTLEVKIVESDPTLNLVIAIGAPLLVLIGAVAAATIAAKTAGRRQERQLAHQVALREQLAHDRKMRYEAHVRDILDRAVEDVDAALKAHSAYRRATFVLEYIRSELAKLRSEDAGQEEIEQAESSVASQFAVWKERGVESEERLSEVMSDSARLRLRLGDHPVIEAHLALQAAWGEHEATLDAAQDRSRTEAEIEESERLHEETGKRFSEVMPQFERLFIEQGRE